MISLMLSLKLVTIIISSFMQLCQASPPQKPCMILGVFYFWFLTGKSSWVPSRTQGLSPTCCRWPVLLWLLQVLPSPGWGWRLDRWARSLLVLVPNDAFVGHDLDLAMYLELWSYVLNYVASARLNLVCNILYLNSDGCNPNATYEML